jgi:hypothetical protein
MEGFSETNNVNDDTDTDTRVIPPPCKDLTWAILCKDTASVIRILDIEHRDVNQLMSTTKQTPLQYACQHGAPEMVPLLLKRGARVNGVDPQGNSVLHIAISRGLEKSYYNAINSLLQHGACVHEQDADMSTPLHLAVLLASSAVVQLLLSYKARIDTEDYNGHNALHCAGWRRVSNMSVKKKIVKILLDHGTNINRKIDILTACAREELIDNDFDPEGADGSPADLADQTRGDMMRASLAENLKIIDDKRANYEARIEMGRKKRCVAFDMGTHKRLGADSLVIGLPVEVMQLILKNT